ncbi:VCBS repeat-containing protein [Winogradskyella sp.]|uniref:VCBS repeat-containing protein n=1 Tax=Winogradskyella sp. TaxID=1883156 RepID=UPI003BA84C45
MKRFCIYFIIIFSVTSCEENKSSDINEDVRLFTLLDSQHTGIDFENKIWNSKDYNIFKYRNFYNGGGVGLGDINNDGLPDIFLTANLGKNKLYLNKGNFVFEDISESAGIGGTNTWSTGVVMVDINNDKLLDIYVCNAGNVDGDNLKNELFINNGDLTFTENAEAYNLDESGLTTHASFFDYDKDGDLDLYLLNNSFIPVNSLNYNNKRELRDEDWDVPNMLKGGGDKLLRNDNNKFVDVSEAANIYGSLIGFGLGVTVSDVNNDNYPDIYVSNDFYERDYLYINNADGTFRESLKDWANHLSQSSMGADIADINNDGLLDVFVTDMLPEPSQRLKEMTLFENYDLYNRKLGLDFYHQYMQNSLQFNLGNGHFSEIANFSDVGKTDWSWGALIFDMDNDGYKDIYVCNGIYNDLTNQDFMNFFANDIIQKQVVTGKKEKVQSIIDKMPSTAIRNYAFRNNQNLTFTNKAEDWGFGTESFSNGAAYGDLDNDGDLDLVINNVNQEVFVYKNNSEALSQNNYVSIKLNGAETNTYGVGAKIQLFYSDGIITREVYPSRGFQSSINYVQTIGLGDKTLDSLVVLWPDGKSQSMTLDKINQTVTLDYKDAKLVPKEIRNSPSTYFDAVKADLVKHDENTNHIDFNYEGLIRKMLSREGPTLSVGDLNGDQLEDVFVGGAKNQEAQIYLQTRQGRLKLQANTSLSDDASFEDTASTFLDVDADGDLDLIVGSGGNELYESKTYRVRLYINNGKGNFTPSENKLPIFNNNTAVICAFDFDADGDKDLFVGGRSVVAVYGINAKHQLWQNNGDGTFTDVTNAKAYAFKDLGMVTGAQVIDIDNDDLADLVISREWDAPIIFKSNGKQLSAYKTNLGDYKGWWNSLLVVDLDGDGRDDIVLGNDGLNVPYKPTNEKPIKMYVNDFDNNGTIEQIFTETIDQKDYPIIIKHELTNQIVSLKKENLKFSEYAVKSISELFPKDRLDQSLVKSVTTSESLVAYNKGNGQFDIQVLPAPVQFSSVNAIATLDINKDGNKDLVLGGNEYAYKPQYARLDASFGHVLLAKDTQGFEVLKPEVSGFFVRGEIKAIKQIRLNGQLYLLAVVNNEEPKLFKLNE